MTSSQFCLLGFQHHSLQINHVPVYTHYLNWLSSATGLLLNCLTYGVREVRSCRETEYGLPRWVLLIYPL